jgi:hypothetical protein
VGYVHVLHQQIVVAHDGGAFRGRSTADGYVLSDAVVVAYLANGVLALELQILRFCGNACAGEDFIVRTNAGTVVDGDTVLKIVVVAQDGVSVYVAKGPDDIVVSELGFRMYVC